MVGYHGLPRGGRARITDEDLIQAVMVTSAIDAWVALAAWAGSSSGGTSGREGSDSPGAASSTPGCKAPNLEAMTARGGLHRQVPRLEAVGPVRGGWIWADAPSHGRCPGRRAGGRGAADTVRDVPPPVV